MKLWLMRLFLAIFVIFLNLTGCSHKARSSEGFTLTFIHVGKGDAFLMTVPGDGYYLVDTGKKKDFEEIREVLEEKGVPGKWRRRPECLWRNCFWGMS